VRRVYRAQPEIAAPLKAIAVGGLAAALLNDSGFSIPMMTLDFALPLLGLACAATVEEGTRADE
jgi:hypothetical protein